MKINTIIIFAIMGTFLLAGAAQAATEHSNPDH